MTAEFQSHLLKYIFHDKAAKRYIKLLDGNIFDLASQETVFDLLKEYIKKYKTLPSKENFIEYYDREVRKNKVDIREDVYESILNEIAKVFSPWDGDTGILKEVLIEQVQKKQTRSLMTSYADKLKTADDAVYTRMLVEMTKIVRLKEELLESTRARGRYLLRDNNRNIAAAPKGMPIFLDAVNKMTGAGGFYSPQLITFLGGPKCFKTGILLNIAIDLMKKGKRVFYADSENGELNIATRLQQGLLNCKRDEIQMYRKELKAIVDFLTKLGGDIRIEFFPKNSTLDDVDAKLDELAEQDGWKPEIIIYDYLDLYKSTDKRVIDKRIHIQDVYHHAIRINERRNTMAFTISTVKASAINKLIVDVQDFGEDSQKAYNCHAAFAICRTKSEMQENTARIIPVVQREGKSYKGDLLTTCAMAFNEECMQIEELDSETYMLTMKETLEEDTRKAKKAQQFRRINDIKDE